VKQTRSIRWGVIGLGWFGEVHAEVLSSMPGIELAAVCTHRAVHILPTATWHRLLSGYQGRARAANGPSTRALINSSLR